MPCTVSPEEIREMEKADNHRDFGRGLTDVQVLEEVACQACRFIQEHGIIKHAPPLVQKWWSLHQEKDAERERRVAKDKEDKEAREMETLSRLQKKYPNNVSGKKKRKR
jgi:hypothetical protein